METLLWILQAALAAVFLITATTKLTRPPASMAAGPMGWAEHVSDQQFRAIGTAEVLGAIGLVLPAALEIAPWLTPLAAAGLAATMAAAAVTHIRLGELQRAAPALILLAIALVIAVERFGPYSL